VKMQMLAGIALASVLALSAMPATHADDFDRATKLTFAAPVRVPGEVLPAGTYWFVIANHGANSTVVQVYNEDRTALVRTFLTAAAERREVTSTTVLAFAKPDTAANPNAEIPALTKWFYPGRSFGNEFIYPKQIERHLQHEAQITVPSGPNSGAVVGD